MNRKDCMAARRICVYTVWSRSAVLDALEDSIQRFFCVFALPYSQAFCLDLTSCIFLESDCTSSLFCGWYGREHIEKELVIDFQKWNAHRDLIVVAATHFWENLINSSWNQATILVVGWWATHRESFSCTCLPITKNSRVNAIDYRVNRLLGAKFKNVFLGGVV
jgi:hypothetical protein